MRRGSRSGCHWTRPRGAHRLVQPPMPSHQRHPIGDPQRHTQPRLPGEAPRGHYSYGVDGDYFAAMGFSLREGRFLTADDSRRSSRVCGVDEDFARYYWPHSSALGQHLFEGSEATTDAESFTVVGVVGAVKQAGLTDQAAQGAVYYPYALRTDDSLFIVVRSSLQPESLGLALHKLGQ